MKFIFLSLIFTSYSSFADPSVAKKISNKNSKCVIKSTAGEYPMYSIQIEGKAVFKPTSDGISNAKISPSGKYAALSGGEVNLVDIEKNKYEYGLVIINCETAKIIGLRKGKPSWINAWKKDDEIQIGNEKVSLKGKLP